MPSAPSVGYVTRAQARARVLTTLRFLRDAQQDTSPDQATRLPGVFLPLRQFHHRQALRRFRTIYRGHRAAHRRRAVRRRLLRPARMPRKAEIRKIADDLYRRVNWPWAIAVSPDIRMAWSPELRVRRARLARLQRSHAGVHPGARQPYLPCRRAHLGRPGRRTTTAAGARSRGRPT